MIGQPGRPKLSIVIPTYNRESMLERCLKSVTATTVDCEIVVCDDGSSDGTPDIIQRWREQDPRIVAFRNEPNRGISFTQMRLFHAARGEYYSELTDDDSVLPGCFESKVAILDAYPEVGLVFSPWFTCDAEGRVTGESGGPPFTSYSYIGGRDEFWEVLPSMYLYTGSMVLRRAVADKLGWTPHDWDDMIRWSLGTKFAFLHVPLMLVGVHPDSYSAREGVAHERFANASLNLWRRWLVHDEDGPVVPEKEWQYMRSKWISNLQNQFIGNNPPRFEYFTGQFELLQDDYAVRASRQFATKARVAKWPQAAKVDHSGAALRSPAAAIREGLPKLIWSGPVFDAGEGGCDVRASVPLLTAAVGERFRLEDVHWRTQPAPLPQAERLGLYRLGWAEIGEEPYVQVWHLPPNYFRADPCALATVGRASFWGDRLPWQWVGSCNAMDAVWVPDEFNARVFQASGVDPSKVKILPLCVDPVRYGPHVVPGALTSGRSFNILSVLDLSERGGWDVLIKAWARSFQASDDVALILVLRPTQGKNAQEMTAAIQQLLAIAAPGQSVAPIQVHSAWPSDPGLPALLGAVQAYVQPGRAENGGRQLLEAMASGRPAIGIRWGSNLTFMNDRNSFLIDGNEQNVAPEHLPTIATEYLWPADGPAEPILHEQPTCHWWEPSVDHLSQLLQTVVSDSREAERRAAEGRRMVAERFAPEVVARRLADLCTEVLP